MTTTTITKAGGWTTITTTTTDTIFQNRGVKPVYINTGDTSSALDNEGVELQQGQAVQIAAGYTVKASAPDETTTVFWMLV